MGSVVRALMEQGVRLVDLRRPVANVFAMSTGGMDATGVERLTLVDDETGTRLTPLSTLENRRAAQAAGETVARRLGCGAGGAWSRGRSARPRRRRPP